MNTRVNFLICGLCFAAALAAPSEQPCDKSKCKGPLKYYEELSCTPIYKEGDCCPYKYNCENVEKRTPNKCSVNGHEYDIGESLRPEDGQPCDIGCVCEDNDGVVGFECAVVDCPFDEFKEGCYQPRNATECCEGENICPETEEDWPTCEVDGKIYKAGEYFSPAGEPKKDCYCGAGYTGENVAPFCTSAPASQCSIELRHAYDIHHKCAPVYSSTQSTLTECPRESRCPNERDEVIKGKNKSSSSESDSSESSEEKSNAEDMQCKFGTLKMKIGDELNQKTNYDSVCVRCVCEVPPVPTCIRLPEDVCDVTDHPPFNSTPN
ncbi:uncharacterized protein LOC107041521 [Diachasma alloeum]|uniref:uncharacterized protein LOC107041521 n=1 Tax=Diachasma alloeum TaxID=454923 RepID=UPI000738330C|nr:uncharacterized protein LOC107041521 [Diachasma alloeum]